MEVEETNWAINWLDIFIQVFSFIAVAAIIITVVLLVKQKRNRK